MPPIDRRTFTGLTLAALASPAQAAADRVIPLTPMGSMPTVPVMLNGKGPYPFLISTGSLFAAVSHDLARELGLSSRATPASMQMHTVRGPTALQLYKADTFNLGGVWPMRNVEMMAGQMSGVFGVFPFLSIQMSSFDFDAREMRAHRGRVQPPPGATKHAIIQLSGVRAIREPPKIRAQYGGKTLQLIVDTGSTGGLTLYPDAVKRLGIWDRYSHEGESADDDGVASRSVLGDPLELGGQRFEGPLVTMMSPADAGDDRVDLDGIIGMEILRRFRITFDPVKQNVWFLGNGHVAEPFTL